MVDLAFTSDNEKWRADATWNWFGPSRIPDLSTNHEAAGAKTSSPHYAVLHAQLTRVVGAVEVYLGGENLLDREQHVRIIAPDDPFGPNFDASIIWGPTNGRMFYGGLRYTLKKKTNNGQPPTNNNP